MPIVNPTVTIRWQCVNSFGMVSGELQTRVHHGYRRKVVATIKEEVKTKNPDFQTGECTISLVNEKGETIYRKEHLL